MMNATHFTSFTDKSFGRYQFVTETPGVAIPCLVLLGISSVFGTFGNILILIAVFTTKNLHRLECVFIANLACSDLYITTIAIPFSIVAKTEGEEYFNRIPGLCRTIASICSVSCVASLGTITLLSFNRYIFICHNKYYHKIFKKVTCICMCVSLYVIGIILVMLNFAGVGGHAFDKKSLDCIWDRMATYLYTVIVSVAFVWVPVIVVAFSYLRIYLVVRKSQKTVSKVRSGKLSNSASLARSFFLIYAVFTFCWVPYAVLAVLDTHNAFSHEVHLYITTWAHMHPSLNWIIYYFTNAKFKEAFHRILHIDYCLKKYDVEAKEESVDGANTSDTLMKKMKFSDTKSTEL